jgi:hypothetical protein
MSEEQNTVAKAMAQANQLAAIVAKVGETIILLSEKRVTLEEKMLRAYLHDLAMICADLMRRLHAYTKDGAKSEIQSFDELRSLCGEIAIQEDELLRIVRYNLNFLEQYFEHDFYDKLVNEHRFIERLREIDQKLTMLKSY